MSGQPGSRVGQALSWKAIQHVGVKLIFMVRLVVLARLLSPDDFGLLAIASVAIDFLLRVTNVGMVAALVQRAETEESHYDLAWTVGFLRGLLIALIVFLAAPEIAVFMADPRATPLIQVLALRPLLQGLTSIKVARLTRELRFRELALIDLPDALVNTVVAILMAPSLGVWALIAGGLAGPAANVVLSYVLAPYRPRLAFNRTAAGSLIQFGRWIFAISLVSVIGTSLLRAVISRELGAVELGLYYLAASLAFLPSELASEIVGAVAFPLFARLQAERERIAATFRAMLLGLATIILPVCAWLAVLAPSLVAHVLGAKWDGTVLLIQLLAVVNVIGLFGETTIPIFNGLGRPSLMAAIETVQMIFLIVFAYLGTGRFGVAGAAAAWLPAVLVSQFLSAFFLRRVIPAPGRGLAGPLLLILVLSAVSGGAAWLIDGWVGGAGGLLLAGLVAGAGYGLAIWWLESRLKLGLVDLLLQIYPRAAAWFGRRVSDRQPLVQENE